MVTQINIDVGPLLAMAFTGATVEEGTSRIVIDRWSTAVCGTLKHNEQE